MKKNKKIKITILGSNGWYSTKTGNTVCLLIESKDYYVILDAGDGLSKLDQYINSDKPIYVFLSHFHLDHIYGIHILNKFRFRQPMKIFGQPGTVAALNKIVKSPYMLPLKKLKIRVTVKDLVEGIHNLPDTPLLIESRYLVHADPCFGYRLHIDGKVISYCVDTGVCDNMLLLSRNADVLIAECSHRPGQQDSAWPHLNPEDSATVANNMNVGKLLLTHFVDISYESLDIRKEAEKAARAIFPDTISCYDGLEIDI